MSLKAKILKKMTVGDKDLLPGDVVDISTWRNARALAKNRYVETLDETIANVAEDSETVKVKKPKATKPKTKK